MNKIELDSPDIVYISENQSDKNFYHESLIFVENRSSVYENKCALLEFNLDILKIYNKNIKQTVLCIPIAQWEPAQKHKTLELDIYRNLTSFNIKTVTWETKPHTRLFKKSTFSPDYLCDKIIQIDVTQIINECLHSAPNNGITLSLPLSGSGLVIHNDQTYRPFLKVFVMDIPNPDEHAAIQIQSTESAGLVIPPGESIAFDKVAGSVNNCFTLANEKKEIIIHKAGYYNVQWTVEMICSGELSEINIGFQNILTGDIWQSAMPINLPCQLVGTALIHSQKEYQHFQLINNSGSMIKLANTSLQATLSIIKI